MSAHNHGPEDGPGLACRERTIDGKQVGECVSNSQIDPTPPGFCSQHRYEYDDECAECVVSAKRLQLADEEAALPSTAGAPTPERMAEIRRVPQEDAMGCGIACLAMISGRSYAEVKATLPEAFNFSSGLTDHTVLWWLNHHGFWNRRSYHDDGPGAKQVPARGLAIALTNDRHFVVLRDGEAIDPARETPLASYSIRQTIEVSAPQGLRTVTSRYVVKQCGEEWRIVDTGNPLSEDAPVAWFINDGEARRFAARLDELRADAERIDWLEQHAMRDDFEDRAGIRIERFTGSPDVQFSDACFRLREWGDTPLDNDGELDFSQRPYRQSDHATLRGAIDHARASSVPSGPKE